jgi:hypothetical protein
MCRQEESSDSSDYSDIDSVVDDSPDEDHLGFPWFVQSTHMAAIHWIEWQKKIKMFLAVLLIAILLKLNLNHY